MQEKDRELFMFEASELIGEEPQDIFVEEQMELNEVAASFSSGSSLSSGSCPGSTVATVGCASSIG